MSRPKEKEINKNKYNVYAALFALMVMLILSFVVKNKYSIQIAAIISSIAYLCEFFYCIYRFLQFEKITFKELFNFSKSDFMWRKV